MAKPCALYDVIVRGSVVYVGVSTNPRNRMHDHHLLRGVPKTAILNIVAWFDDRDCAELAEYERILLIRPKYNIENNPSASNPKFRLPRLMRDAGTSIRQIAIEYRCSSGTVQNWTTKPVGGRKRR